MNRLLLFLFVSFTFLSSCDAQPPNRSASDLASMIVFDLVETANLAGLSIAVSKNGEIIFAEGYGYADLKEKRPVTTETQFRTASVSKVITATGLSQLVQEGRLNLDEPIDTYSRSFPKKEWPITSMQLAGHLSGIPHYSPGDQIEQRFYPSVDDALEVFAHQGLLSEPGTRYRYSTHGFTLLSSVIEGAAEQPFLDYMKETVFNPLGMQFTGPDLRAHPDKSVTKLYETENGVLSEIESPEDPSYKWAGGGLISTPSDLVRMASAYSSGFIEPEVVDIMFSSQRLNSGEETGVGIAWRNSLDMADRRVIEHAGSMGGARSVISLFPEEQLAIAIMTNTSWSSLIEETAHMIALPFLTEPSPILQPEGEAALTITLVNVRGEESLYEGRISLSEGRGNIILDPATDDEQVYRLLYLGRGNIYALIRPDGVFYMTIAHSEGVLRGKATGYGSPQLRSPTENPAFLLFETRFPSNN